MGQRVSVSNLPHVVVRVVVDVRVGVQRGARGGPPRAAPPQRAAPAPAAAPRVLAVEGHCVWVGWRLELSMPY